MICSVRGIRDLTEASVWRVASVKTHQPPQTYKFYFKILAG